VVSSKRNYLICSLFCSHLFSEKLNLMEEGGVCSNLARSIGDFSFDESVGDWLKCLSIRFVLGESLNGVC